MIKLDNLSLKMTKTEVKEKFTDYFDNWVCQLEAFLQLLLGASDQNSTNNNTDTDIAKKWDNEALVTQLTSHHKDYYTAKWAAAHEDVLAFFAPVWLSSLENSCLWITGWKPSMVFRLVESVRLTRLPGGSLAGMTDSQLEKVEELRGKIRLVHGVL